MIGTRTIQGTSERQIGWVSDGLKLDQMHLTLLNQVLEIGCRIGPVIGRKCIGFRPPIDSGYDTILKAADAAQGQVESGERMAPIWCDEYKHASWAKYPANLAEISRWLIQMF